MKIAYLFDPPKELLIEENVESCQTLPIKIVFVISNADTVWNTKSVKLYLAASQPLQLSQAKFLRNHSEPSEMPCFSKK